MMPAEDGGGASGETVYTLLHDRVQQAAYARIPEDQKPRVHLSVARSLLERHAAHVHERIFDIAEHLNAATAVMTDAAERLSLARLDLQAARKAKASAAYEAATRYLTAGLSLTSEDHWRSDYDLMVDLCMEAGERR